MQKTYQRINWENYPSESTPINETNLNAMDYAVDELDNRVITHETTKATKTEVSTVITDVSFNENTGTFTFTRKNGGTITVDTILEKMMINFRYDYENQRLVITLDDGTVQYVDMSALLTQYEFADSDTLAFSLTNGKISAIVKNGSIQEKHLRPEYLAAIKVESAKAESGAKASATSEANAKSYAEQAKASADRAEEVVGITYATEEKAGIVSPQDIYVNPQNGEMSMTKHTTSPTLTNSHAGGIKLIGVHGKSEQKQYRGVQLFDKDNADLKPWYLNGTNVGVLSGNISFVFPCEASTTYTILKLESSRCRVGCFATYPVTGSGYDSVLNVSTSNTGGTFTTTSTAKYILVQYMDSEGETYTSEQILESLQLQIGDTVTEREPYVGGIASPNPDYPQSIDSVVVSEIRATNKNTFKMGTNSDWSLMSTCSVSDDVLTGTILASNGGYALNKINKYKHGNYAISSKFSHNLPRLLIRLFDTKGDILTGDTTEMIDNGFRYNSAYNGYYSDTDSAVITITDKNVDYWNLGFVFVMGTIGDTVKVSEIIVAESNTATDYEEYKESVVTLSNPITLHGIGESIDILTPENVKRRFYTERVTTYMLALKEVNYNDTNTKGFTIIPSKKCASGEADNIKCTIAIYGSGTEKNTCRIKDSESIAIFLDMGEFPSLSDFSNYLASNEVYICYELAEEITEVLPTADQIALRGLKSFDTVTYISTDSEVEPLIDAEYGTSHVGALAIENAELHKVKDVLLEQIDRKLYTNQDSGEIDLNSLVERGTYTVYAPITLNAPIGENTPNKYWVVEVIPIGGESGKYTLQIAYENVLSNISVDCYIRKQNNGVWSEWERTVTKRELDSNVDALSNVISTTYATKSEVSDYMVAVEVEFDFTEVDTFYTISKDITSLIPEGYKVIDAHGVRGGGDYVFISDISLRDNTLSLALYNPSGTIDSGYPAAKIICVRDI